MKLELLTLSKTEKQVLSLHRKVGILGLTGLLTFVSVFLSVSLTTYLSIQTIPNFTWTGYFPYFCLAIAIPMFITPTVCIIVTSLLVKLDVAYQEVSKLSTTDPLTGSTNRRGFITAASQNIHTLREAESCMVGMVDLDKFKQINDTHGHAIGDDALTAIAKRLEEQIAHDGIVGRLGGDEFAFIVFAPEATLEDLKQRLIQHCSRFDLTETIEIGCSIGMVMLEDGEEVDDALARADKCLYDIKQSRPGGTRRSASPNGDDLQTAA